MSRFRNRESQELKVKHAEFVQMTERNAGRKGAGFLKNLKLIQP
jgi:hypothetical protein